MVSCTKTKYKRTCPICSYSHLTNLPSHLRTTHKLSSKDRKPFLKSAKLSVPLVQNQSFKLNPTNKQVKMSNDVPEHKDPPLQSWSFESPPTPGENTPDSIKLPGPFTVVISIGQLATLWMLRHRKTVKSVHASWTISIFWTHASNLKVKMSNDISKKATMLHLLPWLLVSGN